VTRDCHTHVRTKDGGKRPTAPPLAPCSGKAPRRYFLATTPFQPPPTRPSIAARNSTSPPHDYSGRMANAHSLLYSLCSFLLLLACVDALKFDMEAFSKGDKKGQRCIRNFVAKDTLVVVTAIVDGYKGDGMVLNMHVSSFWRWSNSHKERKKEKKC